MNPMRGILMIMAAVSLFTLMSAIVKALSGHVPPGQAVFVRSICAIPMVFGWLWMRGELSDSLRARDWRPHAVRAIAGTGAMGLGFAGLGLLPLAEVTAIRFVTPVLLVVSAALILGETFHMVRLSAVLMGLVGVTVIAWPRLTLGAFGGPEVLGVAVTLASATLAALAQTFIKAMSATEKTTTIVLYFSCTSAVLALLSAPFGWVWPSAWEMTLLLCMGIGGSVGQMMLTASYRYADASALAPFTYITMLWALLVGFVWFDEVPTWPMLGGAALVICAGVVIVLRERRLGKESTARRKVRAKGMM